MRRVFILIGIDDNPMPHFTDEVLACICQGKVFSGGRRHYEIVRPLLPAGHEWINITIPLKDVFARYEESFAQGCSSIVVFVSGDPLFFGFANTLMREMPNEELRIFPLFNSLQQLAHRIPMRYDDMRIVSLTGRPWQRLDTALIERSAKIGVLTDHIHTPAAIAARLLEYGYNYYNMYIGEHLGNNQRERVSLQSLEAAARTDFETPNCIILQADVVPPRPFGLPDEHFEHLDGRSRMITKMPIRLLTLQALDLPTRCVLWDIGFCTGSVSIEARLQFPHLQVCSFEIRPECQQLMNVNSHRFGTPGISVLIGDFLETDISLLPAPDAVFIGGHGGKLQEMLQKIQSVLLPGGCIVFNSVSIDSRTVFEKSVHKNGLQLCAPRHIALDDYNPITIMKAVNPIGNDNELRNSPHMKYRNN